MQSKTARTLGSVRKLVSLVALVLAAVNAYNVSGWVTDPALWHYVDTGTRLHVAASAIALVAAYRWASAPRVVLVPDYVPVRVTEDELF